MTGAQPPDLSLKPTRDQTSYTAAELDAGIDHCYVLDCYVLEQFATDQIVLAHQASGRSLARTTTQHLPDAVNQPTFPDSIVHPGQPATNITDSVFNL